MKKLTILLCALCLVLGFGQASAQTKKTSSKGSSKSSGKSSGGGGGQAGYTTAIGLRGGNFASGLTVKHFFNSGKNAAVEGLVTTEYLGRGARFTLLFEKHWTIVPDVKNLQWYVGAGLHAGAYRGRYYYAVAYRYRKNKDYRVYYYPAYEDKTYPVFGADFVLGLEYKIPDLPVVIGVDYKPYFDVFDGHTGVYQDAAASVRFSF
ncbi:hypothetical protein EJV47_09040 [Hymenobacter gummosus]|uniref:Outer membrane protein beta-barrel domain-containing protein n=1 Tax=Hymenobacter gummosus TaxID=1776032 RepID=A0A431U4S0_9BACT|nr:hypothetical protein [Hymenobacter gummosus]RTQ50763.1 hypothetical protein EJV47_09040 [Hymenobacter gummosus]